MTGFSTWCRSGRRSSASACSSTCCSTASILASASCTDSHPRQKRQLVMNAIAPIWDGNETWLILGGLGLLAVFPLAFAIIIPAVYFPILLMLLAWCSAACRSSSASSIRLDAASGTADFASVPLLATFSQGAVLGASSRASVEGRNFAGTSLDWLTPFSVLTGVALMFGYGCWAPGG